MSEKVGFDKITKIIISENVDVSRMFNYKRKAEFLADSYSNCKDQTIVTAIRSFCKFGDTEHELNKDLYQFSETEMITFTRNIAYAENTFYSRKILIKSYLKWCYQKGLINEPTMITVVGSLNPDCIPKYKILDVYYFKNFKDLYDSMQERLSTTRGKLFKEKNMFAPWSVAVYLGWAGILIDDIIQIRISDINFESKEIFIRSKNKRVSISAAITELVKNCIESNDYCKSEYLIRTKKRESLDKNTLSSLISANFGKELENESGRVKFIQFSRVYLSGLYVRAYNYQIREGYEYNFHDEITAEIFEGQKSSTLLSARIREYEDYCQHFFRQ